MEIELLRTRVATLRDRIAAACARANRDPAQVTLLAVTKTHPPEAVRAALAVGLNAVGENRIQEAEQKMAALEDVRDRLQWHLIGQLQRNKARRAVDMFDLIHSVDSLRLAEALSRIAVETARATPLAVLLEVNVSGEASKSGFALADGVDGAHWPEFLATAQQIGALPGLLPCGLMTIAPFDADLERAVRPCFRQTRMVREALRADCPGADWRELSMGMSGDFEIAVEEGATLVRVGQALFGARDNA